MCIISRLVDLGDIKESEIVKNHLNNYLPIRGKNNVLNYDTVAGNVLGLLIGKRLRPLFTKDEFEKACLDKLSEKLTDQSILKHFKNIYFQENSLLKVSPEFLLLGRQEDDSKGSEHLSEIFRTFLIQKDDCCEIKSKQNFIEEVFWEVLQEYLEPIKNESCNTEPYLPYVARLFVKDIQFLSRKSECLLSHLESFLELYNFIYCSQLALNIKNFKFKRPEERPLYFILDTEKASQERTHIHVQGYQHLFSSFGAVFPILSMLENINKAGKEGKKGRIVPLWQYAQALDSKDFEAEKVANSLQRFAEKFQNKKNIKPRNKEEYEITPKGQLKLVFQYALDQFEKERYGADASRHEIRDAYQQEFVKHVGKNFIQRRGRAGRVLVINQDFLLLLTNIAIGDNRQLRFQELLGEFRQRGVYFDKQSEQALVAFYERVGNVERMSDSGDAVYVRSTI